MTADKAARTPSQADSGTTWRELAVARSLDSARERAEKRVQRFLDAAVDLMSSEKGKDFTVQEVVERSGQSLRSFYQYFAGKHEILLALFEESVRATADHLRTLVTKEDEPIDRLHRFAVEYYRLCRTVTGETPAQAVPMLAMAEFAQTLLTEHPKEAARAFIPLAQLFEEVLDEAVAAGAIRPDIRTSRIAGVVLESIMFNVFAVTIGGVHVDPDNYEADAEELWDFILHGIAVNPD